MSDFDVQAGISLDESTLNALGQRIAIAVARGFEFGAGGADKSLDDLAKKVRKDFEAIGFRSREPRVEAAETPAAVMILPDRTTRSLGRGSAPYFASEFITAQWVVAGCPLRMPAAASTSAPEHTEVVHCVCS